MSMNKETIDIYIAFDQLLNCNIDPLFMSSLFDYSRPYNWDDYSYAWSLDIMNLNFPFLY